MADERAQSEPLRVVGEGPDEPDDANCEQELKESEDEEMRDAEIEQLERARRRRDELRVQLEIMGLEENCAEMAELLQWKSRKAGRSE